MNEDGRRPGDRLVGMDFAEHNAEVKAMWEAFHARRPTRVPVIWGTNTRFFMFSDAANPQRVGFRRYTLDVDVMFDMQLQFQRWTRFNLLQDAPLGLPEAWSIQPDFQNFYEAAWFGCPIEFIDGQVPDTRPAFADDPEGALRGGVPDPFGGLFAEALRFYERFRARAERETFLGRPIRVNLPGCGCGTDGPLTVACNLFGPDFVCTAMIEAPHRLERLLRFITDATIQRVRAWRRLGGLSPTIENYGFADDSCALISTAMYREHVLPHHRALCDALGPTGPRSIHLCGDASRHFPTLRDELGIRGFDTGFPIDFAKVRQAVGPDVLIQGGPHVELLLRAAPPQVEAETRRVLDSGALEGGRFILREGNNLAPFTPLENTEAMYRAARRQRR